MYICVCLCIIYNVYVQTKACSMKPPSSGRNPYLVGGFNHLEKY